MIAKGRGMKPVELYAKVRYAVRIEGISQREAARRFGIDPRTRDTRRAELPFGCPQGFLHGYSSVWLSSDDSRGGVPSMIRIKSRSGLDAGLIEDERDDS